jgi:DNA helicase-2/ATP-dependent DNA helicase PcrA
LAAAEAVISRNKIRHPLTLKPQRPSGPKPVYRRADDPRGEADWIRDRIKALIAEGGKPSDNAVVYRAHHLSRVLEESFVEDSIPYRLLSGVEFYGRLEIKTCLAYLRMITGGDDPSFLRTINLPSRRFGRSKRRQLSALADRSGRSLYETLKASLGEEPYRRSLAADYVKAVETVRLDLGAPGKKAPHLGDLFQKLLDLSGYEAYLRRQGEQERLDNVAEFKVALDAFAKDEDATLEDFLARAALFSGFDRAFPDDAVKLMTIHSAKGLEFPNVFLCGLTEGILPSGHARTPEDLEEERRLCYVAMTRAMLRLHLTDSAGFRPDIGLKRVSRFVYEAGPKHVDFLTPPERSRFEFSFRPTLPPRKAPAREAGDRVEHAHFGAGTIVSIDLEASAYVIRFDRLETVRSLSFDASLSSVEKP